MRYIDDIYLELLMGYIVSLKGKNRKAGCVIGDVPRKCRFL